MKALRFIRLFLLEIGLPLLLGLLGSAPAQANIFADATLSGLTLSCPASINSGLPNSSLACTEIATYSNGSAKVVRSASSWSSSNAAVLSVSGVVIFNFVEGGYIAKGLLGSGVVAVDTPVDISASYSEGGITHSASATVTVKAQKLTALKITCPATVYVGVPGNCTTTASYSDGVSKTVAPTWSSGNEAAATMDSACNIDTYSLCSTLTAGTVSGTTSVVFTASYSENDVTKTATTMVSIKLPPTLTDLVVNCPASVAADSGATSIGSCGLVEFFNGTTLSASQSASWTSSNPLVLSVANPLATSSGLSGGGKLTSYATPVDTTVTIGATVSWYGVSKSASTTVLVKASLPVLTAIAVSCPSSVVAGASATCSAIAVYNNNSSKSINATWTSSNSAAARMTGSALKAGSVTADSPVTITASYSENGVSQSGTATVLIKSNLPVACTQTLPVSSTSVPAGSGSYALSVASSSDSCSWTASTPTPWLHLANSSGSGSAALAFSVDANSGTASRSGSIVIGKLSYTVSQAGSSATPATPITAAAIDCLFDWAEKNYPGLFSPSPAQSTVADNYRFRFYPGTSAYLGAFNEQRLDYIGPQSNGTVLELGDLATWLKTATCQ